MAETDINDRQQPEMQEKEAEAAATEELAEQENSVSGDVKPQTDTAKFREASYVVLFIAAVFTINAMETGSYRTPWPVAIVTLLAGLGLFGYSWYLKSRS